MMKKSVLCLVILVSTMFKPVLAEWVYVGEFGMSGPVASNFDVQKVPVAGDAVAASRAVNLRDNRPHVVDGQWKMGNVVGVVYSGERFLVEKVVASDTGDTPGHVWAEGSIQQ